MARKKAYRRLTDEETLNQINPENISLGFEVKSVDEMIKFIKQKGLEVESGPFQPNPHIRFFHVKDPNGVSVQFVENIN
jgi:lactoylglutathione lyase